MRLLARDDDGQYIELDYPTTLDGRYAPLGLAPRTYDRRQVAVSGNCYGAGSSANSQAASGGFTCRRPHVIAADTTDLRLVFTNTNVNVNVADVDNANSLSVKAAVETGGTIYPVTFGGACTGTVDGGGVLVSDPLAVEIAAGTIIYTRTYSIGTTYYPNAAAFQAVNFGGRVSGDSAYSGTINDSGAYLYTPAAILGTTTAVLPAVLIVGDSLADGIGDRTGGQHQGTGILGTGGGFISRGWRSQYGLLFVAQSSEQGTGFAVQAGHFRRLALSRFATHMLCQHGRNDVTNSHTLAAIQADLSTIWNLGKRRNLKVGQTTITPLATSTDGFSTVGNQSAGANETVRTNLNDWLRDGAPQTAGAAVATGTTGASVSRCAYYDATDTLVTSASGPTHPLTAVLEVADTVESARNSSKWKATGRSVADMVTTASSQTITSATAAFVAGDVGQAISIAGAGTAGAAHQSWIATVTNGTTAVMDTVAVGTVSGAQATIGGATLDGIHPSPSMHASMGAALPKNWLTL